MSEEITTETQGEAFTGPLEIMTTKQMAAYLQVGERSVYNMAVAGEIPAAKVAGQWRFYRPEVERWLTMLSRANMGEKKHQEEVKVFTNGKV
jgi:excisionase family DNA binding protein